jgi:DNA-binding NtrC family response regulator
MEIINIKAMNTNWQKKEITADFVKDNRVKALKSLAVLLLREVELLEDAVSEVRAEISGDNIKLLDEVQRYEADLIRYALIRSKGHQRKAARLLGVKVTTLNAKIKRYRIDFYNLVGDGNEKMVI